MKQQCPMTFIYLNWGVFVAGLVFFAIKGDYAFIALWLVAVPLVMWVYARVFPIVSRYIGYGRVDDRAPQKVSRALAKVTLYTALGCPFCPIVKRRLSVLQAEMGFNLEEVEITLKPDLLIAKGIHAVPVVEVGEQRLVGHATSEQLADFIYKGAGVALADGSQSLSS